MYSWVDAMNGDRADPPAGRTTGRHRPRRSVEHNALYNGPAAGCGPWARCSATSGRKRAATGSSTSWTSKPWGFAGPDVDAETHPDGCAASGKHWACGWASMCASSSTAWADASRARSPQSRRSSPTSPSTSPSLDEDSRRRLHTNPLRILDTKNPALQALVEAAPKLADHLGEALTCALRCRVRRARCAGLPLP
jgi:histidyl-tRNA synthetase